MSSPKPNPFSPTTASEDGPPIFSTWSQLYWLVIILHALLITAFYFLTKHYT